MSKKNRLKPWLTKRFCILGRDRARFIAHMEKVLDTYSKDYNDEYPLVCMDEAAKQIVSDLNSTLPMTPVKDSRVGSAVQTDGVEVDCRK